jgi:hypothetical protein
LVSNLSPTITCTAKFPIGYRASIIEYAHKIEDLLAKMDGVRTEVLPLNFEAIVNYFSSVWEYLHTLTAPVLSLQPSQDDPDKFKSYIEAEEARLENNLRAVDYIIDGTDTLTLITGVGRIEKVRTEQIFRAISTQPLCCRPSYHCCIC